MIIITGAAGFIGSCIAARLNERGEKDLIFVDHFEDGDLKATKDIRKGNLQNKQFVQYIDKKNLLKSVTQDRLNFKIDCLIHMGACSSTTLQDARYFEENNFQYTLKLAQWALKHHVRFIYASSAATYGDGSSGYSDDHSAIPHLKPLNLYGESKQKFDLWALESGVLDKIAGLKFFNVFGPNEYHKGDMRSVVCKNYENVVKEGRIRLFKSYRKEYADGEQKRDFIYVKNAVDIVMFFLDNPKVNGIFNVGTGRAHSWNDLARALFQAIGRPVDIEYMEMPEELRPRYQYFTQAQVSKLQKTGYPKAFTPLEDAIKDYVFYLQDRKIW